MPDKACLELVQYYRDAHANSLLIRHIERMVGAEQALSAVQVEGIYPPYGFHCLLRYGPSPPINAESIIDHTFVKRILARDRY